jgi:hypothetical protein
MKTALAGLLVAISTTSATAENARTNIGVLTCTVAKSAEVQPREMACGFKPTSTGSEEKFTGLIQGTVGDTTAKLVLVWAVLGPADAKVSSGQLAQKYVRTPTPTGQPPIWVGERGKELALQFETNDSASPSLISEIELRVTGTAA